MTGRCRLIPFQTSFSPVGAVTLPVDLSNTDQFPALATSSVARHQISSASRQPASSSTPHEVATQSVLAHDTCPPLETFLLNSRGREAKISYSDIVDTNVSLHQYEIDFDANSGVVGMVPSELLQAESLWTSFLVGHFPDAAPHIAKIHIIVNKIWTIGVNGLKIDAYVINNRMVKFRIPNAQVRDRVLKRGMWNIAGRPMVLSKWSPYLEERQPALEVIPLWVTVKRIPRYLFSRKGISWIASRVGAPKRLHPDTEQCKSFDKAKVFVNLDLKKEIPRSFDINRPQGGLDTVTFHYSWLPPKCSLCHKWGHIQSHCLATSSTPPDKQSENTSVVGNVNGVTEADGRTTCTKEGRRSDDDALVDNDVVGTKDYDNINNVDGDVVGTKHYDNNNKVHDDVVAPALYI